MMTVDVEPDWGCGGSLGIREALPRLLEMFEPIGVRFTFFVVSDTLRSGAEETRILRGAASSHEIASHGKTHRILQKLPRRIVAEEIREARRELEDTLGVEVRGFRAPFLKAPANLCEMLAQEGYLYDASVGYVRPSLLNVPPRRWKPASDAGIIRLPTTSLRIGFFRSALPGCVCFIRLECA